MPAAQLLPGRGSDESIDLLVRGFCRAGVDNVVICPPTFGMYAVAARIQGAAVREVPLLRERGFALDTAGVLAACDANTKIVFLCSPNNPTGNAMEPAAIEQLLVALAGPRAGGGRRGVHRVLGRRVARRRSSRAFRTSSCCARCRRRSAWPARAWAR